MEIKIWEKKKENPHCAGIRELNADGRPITGCVIHKTQNRTHTSGRRRADRKQPPTPPGYHIVACKYEFTPDFCYIKPLKCKRGGAPEVLNCVKVVKNCLNL